VTASNNE
jgi:hypothetical protein